TDPWLWDSDGDGVGDGDEISRGTDPLFADNGSTTLADENAAALIPAAPVSGVTAVEPAPEGPTGVVQGEGNAGPGRMTGCSAYADGLPAQSAYEAAGRTAADPALVNAVDPDWDGIACEE